MFYTTPTDDGAMTVTCDHCLHSVGCPDPFAAAAAITHHRCDPDATSPAAQDREPALDEQPALHLLAGWWVASCPACGFQLTSARSQARAERRAAACAVPSATRSPDDAWYRPWPILHDQLAQLPASAARRQPASPRLHPVNL